MPKVVIPLFIDNPNTDPVAAANYAAAVLAAIGEDAEIAPVLKRWLEHYTDLAALGIGAEIMKGYENGVTPEESARDICNGVRASRNQALQDILMSMPVEQMSGGH